MIPPPAANLREPARKTFLHKPALLRQRLRGMIPRLDVRLHAMQFVLGERLSQYQPQTFFHQPPPRIRRKGVISHRRAAKNAVHRVVQIDDAHQPAGLAMENTIEVMRPRMEFLQIFLIFRRGPGLFIDPASMHRPAPPHRRQKSLAISGLRRTDDDAGFDGSFHFSIKRCYAKTYPNLHSLINANLTTMPAAP